MRFSLGGLATPTEVASWFSQHFPCSGEMGRDSNALMLEGQPHPLVLASFPGTMSLLPFLSCSTDGGVAGKGPPLTRLFRSRGRTRGQQEQVPAGRELSASSPSPWWGCDSAFKRRPQSNTKPDPSWVSGTRAQPYLRL